MSKPARTYAKVRQRRTVISILELELATYGDPWKPTTNVVCFVKGGKDQDFLHLKFSHQDEASPFSSVLLIMKNAAATQMEKSCGVPTTRTIILNEPTLREEDKQLRMQTPTTEITIRKE